MADDKFGLGSIVRVPSAPFGYARFGMVVRVDGNDRYVELPKAGSILADMMLAVSGDNLNRTGGESGKS